MNRFVQGLLPIASLLLPLAFAGELSAQPCELTGVRTLDLLEVRLPSGDPLSLDVHESEVIVRPGDDEWNTVEVRAGLSFDARSRDINYQLRKRVETGHGMVSLHPDTSVDTVRAHAGVRLSAHLSPWATVHRLEVPCPDVELYSPERTRTQEALPRPSDADGTLWRPRGRRLSFRTGPGEGPAIRVELREDAPFLMDRLETRGGWFRVSWVDGRNRVSGWVRRSDVRPTPMIGWGVTGGSGRSGCVPAGRAFRDGLYRGPADLVGGATVRDSPRGAAWGSARATTGYTVMHARGSEWVQIVAAPGVSEHGYCGELHRAWVRLADVRLPDDVDSRRMSPRRTEAPGPHADSATVPE